MVLMWSKQAAATQAAAITFVLVWAELVAAI